MPNSIRVRSNTEYVIEVNDNGDTISFDTADTSLTSRMVSAFERINQLEKEFQEKAKAIDARQDEPYSTIENINADGEVENTTLVTKNQYDGAKLIDEYYTASRAALDTFLGYGACQKIFGGKNYYSMFDDLSEQLKPHFEKIGIDAQKLKTNAVEKHAPNRKTRRAMK